MVELSSTFHHFLSAAFGLVIGSFVNVVVARLPHEKSIVKPGSHCPKCHSPIRWWMNIPVLSYALLRGKCHFCQAQISVRYPIIEVLTATLFVAAEFRFGFSYLLFIRDWPFVTLLVAITFIDLKHRIIPDELSLGGLVLGLATGWLSIGWAASFEGAATGFAVFYFFAWAYQRMKKRSGLGGGDIKLLAMLGAFLGPVGVFYCILISSVFGSIVGLTWAAFRRDKVMTFAIPYGPFLVVGGLYYYLLGELTWLPFTIPT